MYGTKLTLLYGTWHAPFYFYGVVGIISALVAWAVLPKAFTDSKGGDASANSAGTLAYEHVPDKLYNRNLLLCSVAAMVTGLTMFSYIGLYSTFLVKQLNYTITAASMGLSVYGIGCMMAIPIGYIGDRVSQRLIMIVSFIGVMFVSYLMFNVCVVPWAQYTLSFFQGVFFSACLFVNVYALIQRSVRPSMVGRASGIHVTSIFLPASVSGFIFAALVGHLGWGGAAFILLTVLPLVGIAAMLMLKEDQLMIAKAK